MVALKPSYPLYLANVAQTPNQDLAVTDKFTGEIATRVAQADAATIDAGIAAAVEAGQWDRVIDYVNREVFEKPDEYYTLDKLRRAASVDRRLSLREILEKIFGLIPRFKSKDELLEEEFAKFIADQKPDEANVIPALKQFFKAYVTNGQVREIIESKRFTELYTTSAFTTADLKAVPLKYRKLIPDYVKDYVSLNQFVA